VAAGRNRIDSDPEQAVAALDAALALWRGPALAEFASASWAGVAAARLDEIRNAAVEHRFDALLAIGQSPAVVADLEAAVAAAPLRERLWGQLMVALYRSGRQADALRAYQRARHTLAEELGIEPGRELQELERQVLAQSPDLESRRIEREAAPLPAGPEPSVDRIFGRDAELTTLRATLDRLCAGAGAAIAVTGAAGAGKTRLVEAALAELEPVDRALDVRVCRARCVEGDIAPPLWPWLQLAPALGPAGTALAEAIRAQPGIDATSEAGEQRMLDAAVAALAQLGSPPVVLVIDDMQWADAASQHIAQLLVSRLPELPVLLVLTVRDGDHSSTETATTLAAIARSAAGRRVELPALGESAVAQLLAARLGRPARDATIALVCERSGGNAFYVTELIRSLDPEHDELASLSRKVPASVRDVVNQRVTALPDDTRTVLAAGAVLGREFDIRIVQRLTGLSPLACLEAVDLATVAGIVEAGSSATRHLFRHDLTRQAVYDDLPLATRTERHAAAATSLRDVYGDEPGRAIEVASHAWAGRQLLEPGDVIEHLKRGARVALAGYANERAEKLLDRAADVASDLADREERETSAPRGASTAQSSSTRGSAIRRESRPTC